MEAQEIVQALIARGMTQVQIAEHTGIPQPTVSKIMRGKVKDVMSRSYRNLEALLERCAASGAPTAAAPAQQEG